MGARTVRIVVRTPEGCGAGRPSFRYLSLLGRHAIDVKQSLPSADVAILPEACPRMGFVLTGMPAVLFRLTSGLAQLLCMSLKGLRAGLDQFVDEIRHFFHSPQLSR